MAQFLTQYCWVKSGHRETTRGRFYSKYFAAATCCKSVLKVVQKLAHVFPINCCVKNRLVRVVLHSAIFKETMHAENRPCIKHHLDVDFAMKY